mmetsp:Transcript_16567/g.23190  ORF Transcript_16567/g.23190 Transcript_16567/m.23190 type:complete len:211 (+) Transcript_16567:38-670(+)
MGAFIPWSSSCCRQDDALPEPRLASPSDFSPGLSPGPTHFPQGMGRFLREVEGDVKEVARAASPESGGIERGEGEIENHYEHTRETEIDAGYIKVISAPDPELMDHKARMQMYKSELGESKEVGMLAAASHPQQPLPKPEIEMLSTGDLIHVMDSNDSSRNAEGASRQREGSFENKLIAAIPGRKGSGSRSSSSNFDEPITEQWQTMNAK